MSSNALEEVTRQPQSPVSATSEDSDAVNMDSARVYFGPLQSPEKKFSTAGIQTPITRPTMLPHNSVPQRPDDKDLASFETDYRGGTSLQDIVPDEPSLVLATRIMSASDNPSPPPSPSSRCDQTDVLGGIDPPVEDHNPDAFFPQAKGPVEEVGPGDDNSQPDLIVFDSFSTGSPGTNPEDTTRLLQVVQSNSTPQGQFRTTIDDLLSQSPSPRPSLYPRNVDTSLSTHSASDGTIPFANAGLPIPDTTNPDDIPSVTPAPTLVDCASPAPLRRSTRPRRSTSPSRPKLVYELNDTGTRISSLNHTAAVEPPLVDIAMSPARPGPQVKKSNSGGLFPNVSSTADRKGNAGDRILDCSLGKDDRENRSADTHKRLGSLSPVSTNLLSKLLPNVSTAEDTALVMSERTEGPSSSGRETTFKSRPPSEQLTNISDSPAPSPSRPADLNRSPARRVPIAQAIMEGTYSPAKRATTGSTNASLLGTPMFRRHALDDPNRSPARRVPLPAVGLAPSHNSPEKGKAPMNSAVPIKQKRARSTSIEPKPIGTQFERSRSAEPTRPPFLGQGDGRDRDTSFHLTLRGKTPEPPGNVEQSRSESSLKLLPFPLVNRIPSTISETAEHHHDDQPPPTDPSSSSEHPPSSPSKTGSQLRQSIARLGSRIPRIGSKPYARPTSAAPVSAHSSKPPIAPRRATGAAQAAGSSSSVTVSQEHKTARANGDGSSEDIVPETSNVQSVPTQGSRARLPNPTAGDSAVPRLKRKREIEQSKASPPGAQPFVLVRKVVPGMFNKVGSSPIPISSPTKQPAQRDSSPSKPPGPIKIRRVADWKKPAQEAASSAARPEKRAAAEPEASSSKALSSAPPDPIDDQPASIRAMAGPAKLVDLSPSPPPVSGGIDAEAVRPSSQRRSSRTRKQNGDPPSDVFGSVAPVRPSSHRRKRTLPPEPNAFSGMTALALKALTTSNTIKNQQQIVEIQTEIIRKEGKRPDSPTTKVRTTFQRQKEIKAQERQERAERRAKRTSGDMPGDEASDVDDMTLDLNGVPLRHRRGPGDEEDYETPPRPEPPLKRERLDGDVQRRDDRRVKWDRGLATTVYLDDSLPKPKKPHEIEGVKRGCLASTAKTLRLDTLGNVLNANVPLNGLVREEIIVKKFVYEDDPNLTDTPDLLPADPAPVAKPSRTRAKKAKG